jgi:hypothetical protein
VARSSLLATTTSPQTIVCYTISSAANTFLINLIAEKQRISAAGGYVEYGRVNGRWELSLMRAFTHKELRQEISLSLVLSVTLSTRKTRNSLQRRRLSRLTLTSLSMTSLMKTSSS